MTPQQHSRMVNVAAAQARAFVVDKYTEEESKAIEDGILALFGGKMPRRIVRPRRSSGNGTETDMTLERREAIVKALQGQKTMRFRQLAEASGLGLRALKAALSNQNTRDLLHKSKIKENVYGYSLKDPA